MRAEFQGETELSDVSLAVTDSAPPSHSPSSKIGVTSAVDLLRRQQQLSGANPAPRGHVTEVNRLAVQTVVRGGGQASEGGGLLGFEDVSFSEDSASPGGTSFDQEASNWYAAELIFAWHCWRCLALSAHCVAAGFSRSSLCTCVASGSIPTSPRS